uniref:Uncharacterized protein n=1 Tax=Anopheles coluzzii TaxID=1518534 RepID=A0A8W7PKJ3_ANOCL
MARTLALPLLLTAVASVALFGAGVPCASGASSITVEKSAYKNVVIEIRDNVPVDSCQTILQNLEGNEEAHSIRLTLCSSSYQRHPDVHALDVYVHVSAAPGCSPGHPGPPSPDGARKRFPVKRSQMCEVTAGSEMD